MAIFIKNRDRCASEAEVRTGGTAKSSKMQYNFVENRRKVLQCVNIAAIMKEVYLAYCINGKLHKAVCASFYENDEGVKRSCPVEFFRMWSCS